MIATDHTDDDDDNDNDDAMMGRRAMRDARRLHQTPWFPLSNSLSLSHALSPATPPRGQHQNRRPSESTSSHILAEIALICSGKTALMHPWVHFDMFLTLPRPSSSMSRRKSPPWREPPAGVLTAIHTPSALPRPRAGAGHDTMHLPCARELPGQLTGQQTSRPATKPAVCATGTVAPHPHVLVTTHCCLCRLTHAPFAATLAGGSRRTNVLFS
ncbi:hypothetical protein COCCADRAFT_31921 [Bipolaris zeicola 26-R-13]|uniref:Uncharacterized protein n=1 Tax=Cochliobolus carbonum (strain 26-R-13) TaxID=930089 RepID=W6YNN3_COCC2|nr:uncharacterized protein COCCADRAFT_31921 [Bipolaris zeicola 26-R-13]EUC39205.1 hypothetical protein COCCADRAFT_31921 [Bipolaris zeicola 26-R-13]